MTDASEIEGYEIGRLLSIYEEPSPRLGKSPLAPL